MKIVVATDSFKGTLSSLEAGRAIADGALRVMPGAEVVVLPVADGGEGTVEAVVEAIGGEYVTCRAIGPLGESVDATYAVLADGKRAVIEMASASGLTLLTPEQYDPITTSTVGTGQLIADALDRGCRELLLGVGGSATIDGGCGTAQALGVRFLSCDGAVLPVPIGGGQMDRIERIDVGRRDSRIGDSQVTVLCDVTNPLCGPNGAARVFGPQKGANPQQVETLDRNLAHLAEVVQRDMGIELRDLPGAGASGGLAGGLVAFVGANLTRGAERVLDLAAFDDELAGADLVITGEGRLDAQSMMGKVVGAVAARAKAAGVPVIAIAGSAAPDADRCREVLDAYYSVSESADPSEGDAAQLLADRAAEVITECRNGAP